MTFQHEADKQQESKSSDAAIFPLLSGEGNQRLLLEWIADHEEYTLVDPEKPVETADFDCCILDGQALETHGETLRERKQEAEPILLPFLLLLPEADLSVLEVDRGEIADGVVFDTIDEVVSLPIKKVELEWRTEALLRLREQSLELAAGKRKLRQFKRATEAAGHAVYITDAEGRIEYVNPAFEEMTGYSETEAVGETPRLLDAEEMSTEYFDRLWETISNGETWEEDIVNQRKDGDVYHAFQTIAPINDETGTPERFVAIQSDITQRIEAEQRLRLFRDIVERVDDPIMLQDRDGKFRLVNEALTEFAAMTQAELIGETESAFMDSESAARIEERKQQVLDQEQAIRYTISPTFPTMDGETFSTIRYPYYGETGDVEGTIAICRNVTDLKSRESQLQVIDRVLRHNLRNDMTTIGMFAEQIEESAPDSLVEDARRIRVTSEKINRTIEKERKITKFLTEDPKETSVDMVRVVETVVDRLAKRYPDAVVSCELPDSCQVHATVHIEQAFVELLENAIVHSDRDSPTVDVRLTDHPDAPTLTVADDGPGVPEMDRKVLTQGTEIEQLYHGSGLGLWLVHLIVTHSGGTVSFSENEPRGSVVTVQFRF
jgi:PAS domain S-box-containing protein